MHDFDSDLNSSIILPKHGIYHNKLKKYILQRVLNQGQNVDLKSTCFTFN